MTKVRLRPGEGGDGGSGEEAAGDRRSRGAVERPVALRVGRRPADPDGRVRARREGEDLDRRPGRGRPGEIQSPRARLGRRGGQQARVGEGRAVAEERDDLLPVPVADVEVAAVADPRAGQVRILHRHAGTAATGTRPQKFTSPALARSTGVF